MSAGIGIDRGAGLSTQFAWNQRYLVKPAPTTQLTTRVETLHVTSLLPDMILREFYCRGGFYQQLCGTTRYVVKAAPAYAFAFYPFN